MHDVVIIGGGPAGFTAALYSSRGMLDTFLIERLIPGGQMATTYMMENYPGFEEPISGPDLALRMEGQARKFGTKVVHDDVIELKLEGKVKTIRTSKTTCESKVVILCMGASPRELGLPKEREFRGAGVSFCATCDGAFYKNKTVAVIGGGDTAAEDAIFLTRFCSIVFLIHRRNSLRAAKLLQEEVMNNPKIEIIWDTVVEEILGSFGVEGIRIRNLKTNDISHLKLDGIFVAIGTVPNTELVKGVVDLDENGYIITDENMATNIPGVFAAGDIRHKTLRQVITAASDGAIAAYMAERYISENKW